MERQTLTHFFGGRYVNPNDDWRWVINTQRIGGSSGLPHRSKAGLQQIAGIRLSDADDNPANDFGFDGFFLDTIDTAGPFEDAWGYYPWAAEEMKNTVKFIHETYPDKIVMANRGLFFYNPSIANTFFNVRPYDFTIRPFVHAIVFESYILDTNPSQPGISPYFNDNRFNYAPKLIAEANRSDGFTVFSIDYQAGRGEEYYDLAVEETTVLNGWVEYLAQDMLFNTIGTYVIDNPPSVDTSPPQWDSTGSGGFSLEDVPDRVGIQAVKAGSLPGEVVIQWDTAKDQTLPIKYHIYQSTDQTFTTSVKYENVNSQIGEGWAQDPTSAFAYEYTVTGLSPGTYYFRVRAEDSTPQGFEDDNEVTLSISLSRSVPSVSNPGSAIVLDGSLSDWIGLIPFEEDPDDIIGSNILVNWRHLWLSHDETTLYVAYRNDGPIKLNWAYNLYLDVDSARGSGFRGSADKFPIGAEYLLQGRYLYRYSGSGTDFNWSYVGMADLALTNKNAELSLPRDWLGDTSALDLFLLGENGAFGSDSIDQYPDGALSYGGWGAFLRYSFAPISNFVYGLSIDGDLSDWEGLMVFESDAKDVEGSQNLLDWRGLRMAHDIDNMYLAYENEKTVSLNWAYSTYLDVDGSRSTGFRGPGDDLPVGAEFLLQGPHLYRYDGSGINWSWTFVGTATFAVDGTIAEFSFPRSWLDNTERIHIFLLGDNSAYPEGITLDQYPDEGLIPGGGGPYFTYLIQ